MSFRVTVKRVSDGKILAKTEPITDPQELAGILVIMGKPSMFGTPDFQIILDNVRRDSHG